MTMQELIKMTGSEEQAQYVLEILLKNVKHDFVEMAVKAEIKEIEAKAKQYEEDGVIYNANGTRRVNWSAPYKAYGDEPGAAWNATAEQEEAFERIQKACQDAEALLYRRNRTVSLITVR